MGEPISNHLPNTGIARFDQVQGPVLKKPAAGSRSSGLSRFSVYRLERVSVYRTKISGYSVHWTEATCDSIQFLFRKFGCAWPGRFGLVIRFGYRFRLFAHELPSFSFSFCSAVVRNRLTPALSRQRTVRTLPALISAQNADETAHAERDFLPERSSLKGWRCRISG